MGAIGRFLKGLGFLDRVLVLAMSLGALLGLVYLGFAVARGALDPFPTYGQRLDGAKTWLLRIYGGFYLLWAAFVFARALRRDNLILHLLYVFMLIPWGISYWCWGAGLYVINGLFDRGPLTPTEMHLQRITASSSKGRYGVGSGPTSYGAHVNRLDHPDEEVTFSWPGCSLPKGAFRSSRITMFFGQGALGVPWFEPRVLCRPLPIDERPLFDSFRVGRGQPLAIFSLADNYRGQDELDRAWDVQRRNLIDAMTELAAGKSWTVEAGVKNVKRYTDFFEREELAALNNILDGMYVGSEAKDRKTQQKIGQQALAYVKHVIDLHSEDTLVAPWLRAIEKSAADTQIIMVRYAHHRALPRGISCLHCRALLQQDLDKQVLQLLAGEQDLWKSLPTGIFVADGKGHRLFQARLTEAGRIPELAQTLAAPAAQP